ncbi:MAG: TMEM175 family protein [Tepidisphaeraceae bacterium]|jgi:uncharacterized membrane protein
MKSSYNRIAGQSVERLAALSDGIFGVAMTLLLLDLRVPLKSVVTSETDLWRALAALWPDLLVYMMSFMTLGIFWIGQQTQLNFLAHSDRHLTWIHLAFLFPVTLLPFSTRLLIDFITYRAALLEYWFNLFLLGATLYFAWGRTTRANLVKEETTEETKSAICWRIIYAQSLYAVGAALCVFSTYLSIAFIVLLQLNYVIAPKDWGKA